MKIFHRKIVRCLTLKRCWLQKNACFRVLIDPRRVLDPENGLRPAARGQAWYRSKDCGGRRQIFQLASTVYIQWNAFFMERVSSFKFEGEDCVRWEWRCASTELKNWACRKCQFYLFRRYNFITTQSQLINVTDLQTEGHHVTLSQS